MECDIFMAPESGGYTHLIKSFPLVNTVKHSLHIIKIQKTSLVLLYNKLINNNKKIKIPPT